MIKTTTRSPGTKINWGRIFAFGAMLLVAMLALVEPAYAFKEFAGEIKSNTDDASASAQTILWAAAILALIVGIAPMLWGQVKVKWIVSCISAAIAFALIPDLILGLI